MHRRRWIEHHRARHQIGVAVTMFDLHPEVRATGLIIKLATGQCGGYRDLPHRRTGKLRHRARAVGPRDGTKRIKAVDVADVIL